MTNLELCEYLERGLIPPTMVSPTMWMGVSNTDKKRYKRKFRKIYRKAIQMGYMNFTDSWLRKDIETYQLASTIPNYSKVEIKKLKHNYNEARNWLVREYVRDLVLERYYETSRSETGQLIIDADDFTHIDSSFWSMEVST